MKTQPLGPFKGTNTRRPDFALQDEDGTWLRRATNLDIDNAGRLRVRRGLSLVQAITGPHSLVETLAGDFYLVRSSTLYKVTLPSYSETLVKILSVNDPVSYCEHDGFLYFSNGTDSGFIDASGSAHPIGLATPSAPSVSGIAGTLHAGKYQVGVTYTNATTGREGGHAGTTSHELLADGALRVTLPGASPGATHVNVYVSRLNGSVAYLHSTVAIGTATLDITNVDALGRQMSGLFEEPLPAGSNLFFYKGALCCLSGDKLLYGNPFRPGYYTPTNFIWFESPPSVAAPTMNGVYVAHSKTQWIAGPLDAPEAIVDLLPYGAVPGTAFALQDVKQVGWFGAQGFVLGDENGQAAPVMASTVSVSPPASGFAAVIDGDGFRRVVSCGWCMNTANKATTEYADFPITSFAGGYATTADGVFVHEGYRDGVGNIEWLADFGRQNFGVEELKHMPTAYIGVASAEPVVLRVTKPDGEFYDYAARNGSANMEIQRIDSGKGLRENWFGLALTCGTTPSDFTLASVSFAPVSSGRRI